MRICIDTCRPYVQFHAWHLKIMFLKVIGDRRLVVSSAIRSSMSLGNFEVDRLRLISILFCRICPISFSVPGSSLGFTIFRVRNANKYAVDVVWRRFPQNLKKCIFLIPQFDVLQNFLNIYVYMGSSTEIATIK